MATVHVTIEITGDDAMLVYKAAKQQGISVRRFVVDAATARARHVLKMPRLVASKEDGPYPLGLGDQTV